MDQGTTDAIRTLLPGTTTLGAAIRRAVDRHPSVSGDAATRSHRRAAMTVEADTMANLGGVSRPEEADQIVDEAAISLRLHVDRTAPVDLHTQIGGQHIRLARLLAASPSASKLGFDIPITLARCEAALMRVRRMRSRDLHTDDAAITTIRHALVVIIRTALQRGTPIDSIDDADLLELVEDAYESIIFKGRKPEATP